MPGKSDDVEVSYSVKELLRDIKIDLEAIDKRVHANELLQDRHDYIISWLLRIVTFMGLTLLGNIIKQEFFQ